MNRLQGKVAVITGGASGLGAQIGRRIRVIRRTGAYYDYPGYGPFGDGRFSIEHKGMPVEEVVGSARILDVQGDLVTLDTALPAGDIAYLMDDAAWPTDGGAGGDWAGAAGFAFARVLADASGRRMVPHFLAVDVVSDNRILPARGWQSVHVFDVGAPGCAVPEVRAALVHRAYPSDLARERGWPLTDGMLQTRP